MEDDINVQNFRGILLSSLRKVSRGKTKENFFFFTFFSFRGKIKLIDVYRIANAYFFHTLQGSRATASIANGTR